MTNFSKKKGFTLPKEQNPSNFKLEEWHISTFQKFQIGGFTYQIKIDIYDNYVWSEVNFFKTYSTYQILMLYTASVA